MLKELKQKISLTTVVSGVCFPPTSPLSLCHVNPKGLIENQELNIFQAILFRFIYLSYIQMSNFVLHYMTYSVIVL